MYYHRDAALDQSTPVDKDIHFQDRSSTLNMDELVNPGVVKDQPPKPGAAADAMIDTAPLSVGAKEYRPLVRTLQRANTTTLGDMLDPTYMDPELWKSMPMHLVELILSKVPFRNLVAMRRVCKDWNALILSEGFSPPFVPALIMFARTPTVRKMMWERSQPAPKVKERRRWSIFRIWRSARRMLKTKSSGFG